VASEIVHNLDAINGAYRLGHRALPPIGSIVEWRDYCDFRCSGTVQRCEYMSVFDEFVIVLSLTNSVNLSCASRILVSTPGFKILDVPGTAPPFDEWWPNPRGC
jgi:hypothetical protein